MVLNLRNQVINNPFKLDSSLNQTLISGPEGVWLEGISLYYSMDNILGGKHVPTLTQQNNLTKTCESKHKKIPIPQK